MQVRNQTTNFGMALKIKGRAINDTAIFPNKHANIIRKALASKNDELERLSKKADITIDVEPPDRGLDFKGVENFLVVKAQKPPTYNNTIFPDAIVKAVKSLTTPVSGMSIKAKELEKTKDPGSFIIEMVKKAKKGIGL